MTNRKIKLEHFVNLVAIAAADGYMDAREREFLAERAEETGMNAEEFDRIIKDADKLQHVVPLNQVQPEDQIMDAIFISIVDGEIAEQEHQLCVDMACRLGLDKEAVEEAIDEVKAIWTRG
ncbi:MAG: hypothetical protein WBA23_12040 [Tunicatimonas sp.]|uniref:hypothetical protein n=1 Tax=Tunicatimonas sp. TaxID=1940096 RepID=UPI003C723FC5